MFELFQEAEELAGAGRPHPAECVMIGDRLSTDIAFGNAVGCRTVHVETGCETLADIPREGTMPEDLRRAHIPHFAAASLPAIIEAHRGSNRKLVGPHKLSVANPRARSVLGDVCDAVSSVTLGDAQRTIIENQRRVILGGTDSDIGCWDAL